MEVKTLVCDPETERVESIVRGRRIIRRSAGRSSRG